MTTQRRLWSATLLLVAANAAIAAGLVLPRESHVPGGVFTTIIPGAAEQRPAVSFDGQPAMVVREGDHWRAVVGIPLSTQPGKSAVVVKLPDGAEKRIEFDVKPKKYSEQRLKVEPRVVDLSPPDLAHRARTAGDSGSAGDVLRCRAVDTAIAAAGAGAAVQLLRATSCVQ